MNPSKPEIYVIENRDDLFQPDQVLRRVLHSAGIPYSEAPIGFSPRFYVGDERTGRVGFSAMQNPALRSTPSQTAKRCFHGVEIDYLSTTTDAYGAECDPQHSKQIPLGRFYRDGEGEMETLDLNELRKEYVAALASSVAFTARANAEMRRDDKSLTAEQSHAEAIRSDAERRAAPTAKDSLGQILKLAQVHDNATGFYKAVDPYDLAKVARDGFTAFTIGPKNTSYERPVSTRSASPDIPPSLPSLDAGSDEEVSRLAQQATQTLSRGGPSELGS